MSGQGDVLWLQPDVSRFPEFEIYEYVLKKPLVAASLVFRHQKSDTHHVFEAEANARLPLQKPHKIAARSELDETGRIHAYNEQSTFSGASSLWRNSWSADDIGAFPAPVLNSLLIFPSFAAAYRPEVGTYRALFEGVGKLFALEIKSAGSSVGIERPFIMRAVQMKALPDQGSWDRIAWSKRDPLELVWDDREKVVRKLSYRLPALGALDLQLIRFERR